MSFSNHARALIIRQLTQQKRSWRLNVCFVSAPLVLCSFLFLMQFVVQTLMQKNSEYVCACQCIECCQGESCSIVSSLCDQSKGFTCRQFNYTNCGPQFSSSTQAAFCAVPRPSSWPPVMRVPAPQFRAKPWAPHLAMLYSDTGIGPSGSLSGSDAAADLMGHSFPGLEVTLGEMSGVLEKMKALVEPDRINAHLLSLFGFTYANQRAPSPSLYYADGAITSTSTDVLWVVLPHGACTALGLPWFVRIDLPDFVAIYLTALCF